MQDYSLSPYELWFEQYVDDFRTEAKDKTLEMVEMKISHTMRVLGNAREIMKESGGSPELQFAMEVAALLHDVGRFPQLVKRESFDDTNYNHAEIGEQILRESDVLNPLPVHLRGVVLSAVKFHNLGVLPGNLGPDARLVLEVVRDADKLDAIRNILRYLKPGEAHGKALKSGLTWDENAVSSSVLEAAQNRQLIAFKSIKWSNDFVLFVCCWLYDLHFNFAFKQLKESGNFERLLAIMPNDAPFADLKIQLREDLDWIEARSR